MTNLLFVVASGQVSPENNKLSPSKDTLCFWATKILCTPDPKEKASRLVPHHFHLRMKDTLSGMQTCFSDS